MTMLICCLWNKREKKPSLYDSVGSLRHGTEHFSRHFLMFSWRMNYVRNQFDRYLLDYVNARMLSPHLNNISLNINQNPQIQHNLWDEWMSLDIFPKTFFFPRITLKFRYSNILKYINSYIDTFVNDVPSHQFWFMLWRLLSKWFHSTQQMNLTGYHYKNALFKTIEIARK